MVSTPVVTKDLTTKELPVVVTPTVNPSFNQISEGEHILSLFNYKWSEKRDIIDAVILEVRKKLLTNPVVKNRRTYTNKYADINAIYRVLHPLMYEYDLLPFQLFHDERKASGTYNYILTEIRHVPSQQWVMATSGMLIDDRRNDSGYAPLPGSSSQVSKKDDLLSLEQKSGKTCTYNKRYSIVIIMGIEVIDDNDAALYQGHGRQQLYHQPPPLTLPQESPQHKAALDELLKLGNKETLTTVMRTILKKFGSNKLQQLDIDDLPSFVGQVKKVLETQETEEVNGIGGQPASNIDTPTDS